jgi:hypothetical protein
MLIAAMTSLPLMAQTAPTPAAGTPPSANEDETIMLSPFEVSATDDQGYTAATTLAGSRLNTNLRDIGNAVSVVTAQFMKDIGATDNETLLQYTTSTEVGNVYGNFAGMGDGATLDEASKFTQPNQNTRVRGLTSADNTRDYFMTDIPWDGYSVDAVDLQRGPNSILFGQGSPAGIINTRTKQASFRNANEVTVRFGSFGSKRATLDLNRVLIKDQLALRIAALSDDEEYKQDPAYQSQKRIYGATRWEPGFLKKGSARTIVTANFEAGDVSSNRPRSVPPIDAITPWFQGGTYEGNYVYNASTGDWDSQRTFNNLNRGTFIPAQLQDDNTGTPNHGQMRPSINGGPTSGTPNPAYQPWLGNFGQQYGGPLEFYNVGDTTPMGVWVAEPKQMGGINADGQIDNTLALAYQRPASVSTYSVFAKNAQLPFASEGIWKDKVLTDPSVFDFYNKLLDGPNKKEWQKFRAYNLSLVQTFFDDQAGFQLIYNNEWSKRGQLSLMSGSSQGIYIDVNSVYADGTPAGVGGEPYADGTPNPNVGRAFVTGNGISGNNESVNTKESSRATVFLKHDFTRDGGGLIHRILGVQTINGLAAQDKFKSDYRQWQRYAIIDPNYDRLITGTGAPLKISANELVPNTVVYLSDSLSSRASASGANLSNPTAVQIVTSGNVRTFDGTWNAPGVDPAAVWYNDYYPAVSPVDHETPLSGHTSTQSENPANYIGWTDVPVNVTDSEAADGNRAKLTTFAQLQKQLVTSTAAVYQGNFWDNSIVATWGVRKDISKSWSKSKNDGSSDSVRGVVNLTDDYELPDTYVNRIEVTSHAWTVMAHLNQLPFIGKWANDFPIQVSLYYNRSSNFQPASQRVDVYGDPIAAPSGKTVDKGILLETKNGKYSLKINKYETSAVNASSSALGGTWFIGTSQAWSANCVNRFEFNWTQDTNAGAVAVNDPTQSQYNYGQAPGESLEQAQAREASVIAAWRAWQASVNPKFYQAWGINLNDPTKAVSANAPAGFAVTEDSVSKGYEFEFAAQPTHNWRISINAAKTTAVRNNIGGAALSDFINSYQKALSNGAPGTAGDLRIWWGGSGNETASYQWKANIGSEYAQRKLQEGTNVPELREWRFNAISNYDFDHGFLKGVNVGVGVRYESDIVIGYSPLMTHTADGDFVTFDLTNPYKGPSETNFDFWVGYGRKISDKIDWRIQLNVRNAFVGNELIPVTTQPDGSGAAYRIRPPQTWQITNTFRF